MPGTWRLFVTQSATIQHGSSILRQRTLASFDVGLDGARGIELRLEPERQDWRSSIVRLRFLDARTGEPLSPMASFTGIGVSHNLVMAGELHDGRLELL